MSSARQEFGPSTTQAQNIEQRMRDMEQSKLADVKQAGQTLHQAGATGGGDGVQTQGTTLKTSTSGGTNDVRKDLGVAQGERPALSPDDRNRQVAQQAAVKQAGDSLKKANATVTAAKQFSPPAQTPKAASPPPPSRSR